MIWFVSASLLSALWCVVHLVMGGKEIATPLRQSTELSRNVRDTQYLCWHFTSCGIAIMAASFAAAVWQNNAVLAWPATALAASFALTGIGLVAYIGQSHLRLPQGWLFVPVTVLGVIGIAAT